MRRAIIGAHAWMDQRARAAHAAPTPAPAQGLRALVLSGGLGRDRVTRKARLHVVVTAT
jgi:hypothetical protein